MKMKMRLKMKNRSLCDINRPRVRQHRHKDTEYKMCQGILMIICVKKHLSNNSSSVHEKVKQD